MRVALPGCLLAIACAAALASTARADEVILKTGGAIRGRIVSESEQEVVIETGAGTVKVERARIREVTRSPRQPPARTPAAEEDVPAPAPPAATPTRTLLVFAFDGADAALVADAAARAGKVLGVAVEVLPGRPKPDERVLIDRRTPALRKLAEALGLDAGGSPEQLEGRIRGALRGDPRPEARQVEAQLDQPLPPCLAAERLEAQGAELARARLADPAVVGVIGVTERDMTTPGLNFVFGHGDRAARAGVASYVRFGGRDVVRGVVAHRLAVQLLSTTGVLLGLGRCQDPTCVRAFPNDREEHDRKRAFCAACRPKVEAALRR